MNQYKPTVKNVLALYRWCQEDDNGERVKMDWCTTFTRAQAKVFLRNALDAKIEAADTRFQKPSRERALKMELDMKAVAEFQRSRVRRSGRNLLSEPRMKRRFPQIDNPPRD